MPVSEILHAAGVDFAGSLPAEIQFFQVFSAAVVAGSGDIESAKRLIEFVASASASEAIRESGMEPLSTSRECMSPFGRKAYITRTGSNVSLWHKQTSESTQLMSAFGGKADITVVQLIGHTWRISHKILRGWFALMRCE